MSDQLAKRGDTCSISQQTEVIILSAHHMKKVATAEQGTRQLLQEISADVPEVPQKVVTSLNYERWQPDWMSSDCTKLFTTACSQK